MELGESKFGKSPEDFDICIHGVDVKDEAQEGWWRGEMSKAYGKGAFSDRTQAQITMKALRKVGFESDDLSDIEEFIVGKEIPFRVKATEARDDSGKIFYNVVGIGGGGEVIKAIDKGTLAARMKAIMGGDTAGDEGAKPAAKSKPAKPAKPAPAADVSEDPFA
jgi:hypothetical protein